LGRGAKADGYIVTACCEVLADWPQWDSIPVLLDAMRVNQQISGQELPTKSPKADKLAVWREADAALRLVSGEWPMPEPDASAQPIPAGSAQDLQDKHKLEKTWDDWWASSSTLVEPVPQVRMELTWTTPSGRPTAPHSTTVTAATSMLWVRPTGSIYFSRLLGTAPSQDDPTWKWDDRTRRQCEFHLNAMRADAVRTLGTDLFAAAAGTTWAINRPQGLSANWRGRLQVVSQFGDVGEVELAETGTPGAIRPPASSTEALSELLTIPTMP
jgi:hypothetical protein